MGTGIVISMTGYYWPFLIAAPPFAAIGGGLLYTVKPETSAVTVAGYTVLVAVGVGAVMQNGLIAVQAAYASTPADIPQGALRAFLFQVSLM